MKESVTYQAIVEEGAVREAQEGILRQGRKKFGASDSSIESTIRSITELDRLHYLSERLLDVSSWTELMAMS